MSAQEFNWSYYINVAEEVEKVCLNNPNCLDIESDYYEALLRTAISRLYYCSYNIFLNYIKENYDANIEAKYYGNKGKLHGIVRNILKDKGHKEEVIRLKEVHEYRINADYTSQKLKDNNIILLNKVRQFIHYVTIFERKYY